MASKYSQKFPIPGGFPDILHDFAREILRDQPDDIIEYAALYFEALRDNKPFHYESKYNVKPETTQGSHYNPKGKVEFDPHNPPQQPSKDQKHQKSQEVTRGKTPTEHKRHEPQREENSLLAQESQREEEVRQNDQSLRNETPINIGSQRGEDHYLAGTERSESRGTSHKDEKSLAREYIKDLNEEVLEQADVNETENDNGEGEGEGNENENENTNENQEENENTDENQGDENTNENQEENPEENQDENENTNENLEENENTDENQGDENTNENLGENENTDENQEENENTNDNGNEEPKN